MSAPYDLLSCHVPFSFMCQLACNACVYLRNVEVEGKIHVDCIYIYIYSYVLLRFRHVSGSSDLCQNGDGSVPGPVFVFSACGTVALSTVALKFSFIFT